VGAIALDADVVIGFLNRDDPHHAAARKLIAAAERDGDRLVMAVSVYAETMVGPLRAGLGDVVDDFIAAFAVELVPVDRDLARETAILRARHRTLRLPDAMALAVARLVKAELKTFDRRLARIAAARGALKPPPAPPPARARAASA
jgi:predicted nucleic acid-binding protein